MQISGQIRYSYALHRHIVYAALSWWLAALPIVIGLLLVFAGVRTAIDGDPTSAVLYVLGGLFFGGILEIAIRNGWRRVQKLAETPWQYELTDEGLRVKTPQTEASMTWDTMVKGKATARLWLLKSKLSGARVAIPKEAFSPEDQARISEFLR